jgi:predicted transcriptional regulator
MKKIITVCTPILKADMDELKKISGKITTKETLLDAVDIALKHYRDMQQSNEDHVKITR